ncbi:hypothetical protein CXF70_01710 [Planomicrobium sp. MB-3u-38]|nr:hypothetical protein CXF70_01710 [Planomicrobium sp. MB-3u-38]
MKSGLLPKYQIVSELQEAMERIQGQLAFIGDFLGFIGDFFTFISDFSWFIGDFFAFIGDSLKSTSHTQVPLNFQAGILLHSFP